MECPLRGELATLGLLVRGTRLEDMAAMGAGVGDRDTVAMKLPNQHALEEHDQSVTQGVGRFAAPAVAAGCCGARSQRPGRGWGTPASYQVNR